MKKEFKINRIEKEFNGLVYTRLPNGTILTPEKALDLVIEFYNSTQAKNTDITIPDNDMLLFSYGTYDWQDGNGRNFSLNLTRQFILQTEDEPYQLVLTLYYSPNLIGNIDSYTRWSIDDPGISEWVTEVRSTAGFKIAGSTTPKSFDIRFSQQ